MLKGIAVDLDGTLIKTDLSLEGFVLYLRKNPLRIFKALYWELFKGRSAFKCLLEKEIHLDPRFFPYKEDVIDWLVLNKKKYGVPVILITGSPTSWGKLAAGHIELLKCQKIFDDVVGSEPDINRIGMAKVEYLHKLWGHGNYIYVGDSKADRKVFRHTQKAVIVGTKSFFKKTKKKLPSHVEHEHLVVEKKRFQNFVNAISPIEILFNLLIIAPMLIYNDFNTYRAILAFLSFSFITSSLSLFEALSGIAHENSRPFAKGDVSIITGIFLSYFLFSLSMILSFNISIPFFVGSLGFALFFFQSIQKQNKTLQEILLMLILRAGLGYLLLNPRPF